MKTLHFCTITLLLALAGCAAQKPVTQKPSPIVQTIEQRTLEQAAAADIVLDCANGQARNLHGNCPAMKPCAKRCTWSTLAPPKQQCLTYLGAGVVTGYDTQTAPDGKACAWVKD